MKVEINTEKWKGYVVLHNPIPMIKLAVFEESITEAIKTDKKLSKAKSHATLIPAMIECVAEWHIEGFPEAVTVETFPGAGVGMSKVDITILVNFIVDKLMKLYQGEDPNA